MYMFMYLYTHMHTNKYTAVLIHYQIMTLDVYKISLYWYLQKMSQNKYLET